jgi:hypothetical protein
MERPGSQASAGSIRGPRDAFIHEGERVVPLHVSGVELLDVKSLVRVERSSRSMRKIPVGGRKAPQLAGFLSTNAAST